LEEGKLKKIVSLITIAVIVVFVAMVIGLVFQFVNLANLKSKKKVLDEKISYYTAVNEDTNYKINYYKDSETLEDMYRALGYGKEGDIKFE